VDIGGHPPISLAQNTLFQFGSFSTIFRVLNFRDHFEALNDIFFGFTVSQKIVEGSVLGPFYYCTPRKDLSNGLSSDPNKDHMQKLLPQEVGIPTYHFGAHKTVGVSSSRVLFRVFFPSIIYAKKAFGIFVILTGRMRIAVTPLLRDKLPPFK
jgi:hypothetical protein